MKRKKILRAEEMVFKALMRLSALSIMGVLGLILFSILYRGLPSLSWEIVSQTPGGGYYFGKSGGILNAIIGSLYLATGASFIALLIGMPLALFMNIHMLRFRRSVAGLRFILDLMWGVPSIVYGAFGFTLMIWMGMKSSLLGGMITVSFFILPVMIRAMDEVFMSVPRGLLEAGLSLGTSRWSVAVRIFIRQTVPGIATAVILSFGRAIGDAAAVLFTTGYTDHIPVSLMQPAATLPLAIFFQLGSPFPEVQNRAYAAAVILTAIVLLMSLLTRSLTRKFDKHKIRF